MGFIIFYKVSKWLTPKKDEINIDLLPSLTEKLNAEHVRKNKEKKRVMPGEALLKKLHKEQKKNKNKVAESENLDNHENQKKNIDKIHKLN